MRYARRSRHASLLVTHPRRPQSWAARVCARSFVKISGHAPCHRRPGPRDKRILKAFNQPILSHEHFDRLELPKRSTPWRCPRWVKSRCSIQRGDAHRAHARIDKHRSDPCGSSGQTRHTSADRLRAPCRTTADGSSHTLHRQQAARVRTHSPRHFGEVFNVLPERRCAATRVRSASIPQRLDVAFPRASYARPDGLIESRCPSGGTGSP